MIATRIFCEKTVNFFSMIYSVEKNILHFFQKKVKKVLAFSSTPLYFI